jgi:hypothetical protein
VEVLLGFPSETTSMHSKAMQLVGQALVGQATTNQAITNQAIAGHTTADRALDYTRVSADDRRFNQRGFERSGKPSSPHHSAPLA